jgi:hypothetical protein
LVASQPTSNLVARILGAIVTKAVWSHLLSNHYAIEELNNSLYLLNGYEFQIDMRQIITAYILSTCLKSLHDGRSELAGINGSHH